MGIKTNMFNENNKFYKLRLQAINVPPNKCSGDSKTDRFIVYNRGHIHNGTSQNAIVA